MQGFVPHKLTRTYFIFAFILRYLQDNAKYLRVFALSGLGSLSPDAQRVSIWDYTIKFGARLMTSLTYRRSSAVDSLLSESEDRAIRYTCDTVEMSGGGTENDGGISILYIGDFAVAGGEAMIVSICTGFLSRVSTEEQPHIFVRHATRLRL